MKERRQSLRPLIVAVVLLSAMVAVGARVSASIAAPPTGFTDVTVTTVSAPTAMAFTPDGRMLITTSTGALRVYQNGALVPTPALDLAPKVCTQRERGMLGVAVDPDFTVNHYIYLYYTYDKWGGCSIDDPATGPVNRMSRFVLDDLNHVDPSTEHLILDNIPAYDGIHNAGDLHFGRNGDLFVSVGDGGCYYRDISLCGVRNPAAQQLNDMQGNILRIRPDGSIPADNPFTGPGTTQCGLAGYTTPDLKCQEVYAWGLRNPFRFALDPNAAGDRFFIDDVGSNNWEEVDAGAKGANYGWPVREGLCAGGTYSDCNGASAGSGFTDPVYAYSHNNPDGCASITGGTFVPNGLWPSQYDNTYLFSDFVCGKTWALTPAAAGGTVSDFGTPSGPNVGLQFGPAPGGGRALYYIVRGNQSQIHRVTYTGNANRSPHAAASATPTTSDSVPVTVSFDSSQSSDADGDPLTFDWDFGDGSAHDSSANPAHTYATAGRYVAKLTVTDPSGASDQATVEVDAGDAPPAPVIDAPSTSLQFAVGQHIVLKGHATDLEDGALPDSSLSWEVHLHHNSHWHPYLEPTSGNNVEIVAPAPEDMLAAQTSYLQVYLTATDSKGVSQTVEQDVQPDKVPLTFATSPAGLDISANELTVTGPANVTAWAGEQVDLSAADQTDSEGNTSVFKSWSDGGSATHRITVPSTPQTYTASFDSATSRTSLVNGTLTFDAGSGQANAVTLTQQLDGSYAVADSANPVAPGPGCMATTPSSVSCNGTITQIVGNAGDGDDQMTVSGNTPAFLNGGPGNDRLTGGSGDDTIDGGTGTDTIAGGAGSDTVSYASRTDGVTVRLNGRADDGAVGENDAVANDIENVTGGSGDDTLVGNAGPNTIDGGAGNDYLEPQQGRDTISGGPGTGDRVSYQNRTQPVNVSLDGVANDGEAGENDLVGSDVEGIYGGEANDTLTGNAGPNLLRGYGGNDVIDGGAGADTIAGGAGTDTVTYAPRTAAVTVRFDGKNNDGEAGENDSIASDVENITGGAGDDTLVGDAGNNTIDGGPGNDYIEPGKGADVIIGGAGTNDRVSYLDRTQPVNVSLDGVANDGEAGENDLVGSDVESVYGGSGNDTITGNNGNNVLRGNAGSDTISGGPGDDVIDGGTGTDTLSGGTGIDTLSYDTRSDPVTIRLDGVANDGAPGENDNAAGDFENAYGGSGDDTIIGNSGPNYLAGNGGNDYLEPQQGRDTISGGPGTGDRVSYQNRTQPVNVSLDGVANDGEAGENDLVGSDVEGIYGGEANDTLTGNAGPNLLRGYGGNDVIDGGAGADTIAGGAGTDTVTYAPRTAAVTVRFDGKNNDGEAGENDSIASDVENITGGAGDDTLVGDAGNNTIDGGPGNDYIEPGKGADVIIGGAGTNDRVSYLDRTQPVNVSLDGVANDGEAGENDLVGSDVESVYGGSGNDTITGNNGNNVLDGQGGDDTINGLGGNDTFRGGAGNDTLLARDSGPDNVQCGADDDTVTADNGDVVNADCEHVSRG